MKTFLDIYRGLHYNLDKVETPALYPEDFNHFYSIAVNNVINKFFINHERDIQSDDNLRSLLRAVEVTPSSMVDEEGDDVETYSGSLDPNWRSSSRGIRISLPKDYYHLRNCYATIGTGKKDCDGNEITKRISAKRLTSDKEMAIENDWFLRPHGINGRAYYLLVGNSLELQWGFKGSLNSIRFHYLKVPLLYTVEESDLVAWEMSSTDVTPETGFSEYMNKEILLELTTLVLAKDSDPRVQSMPQVGQSIPK